MPSDKKWSVKLRIKALKAIAHQPLTDATKVIERRAKAGQTHGYKCLTTVRPTRLSVVPQDGTASLLT